MMNDDADDDGDCEVVMMMIHVTHGTLSIFSYISNEKSCI